MEIQNVSQFNLRRLPIFSNVLQDEQLAQSILTMEQTTTMIPYLFNPKPIHFCNKEHVESLFGFLNFREVEVVESYGSPSLALIVKGVK